MKFTKLFFYISIFFFIFSLYSCNKDKSENKSESSKESIIQDNVRRYNVIPGTSPAKGKDGAAVTIIVFSDFECPFCKKAAKEIKMLQKKNSDHLRVVFKNFPINRHRYSLLAAKAGVAAQNQNAFWQMHDILFAKSKEITLENVFKWAENLKLDIDKFKADLNSEDTLNRLRKDKEEAVRFGLRGTPYIFVNGIITQGLIEPTVKKEFINAEKLKNQGVKNIFDTLMKDALNKYEKKAPGVNAPKIPKDIFKIPPAGSLVYGNIDAPITILAFVDFEGKLSKTFFETAEDLSKLYSKEIRFYVISHPLSYHKKGAKISKLFYAADSFGKTREIYELIYKEQINWTNSDTPLDFLVKKSATIGLETEKLIKKMNSTSTQNMISKDREVASKLQIRTAPAIFINGRFVPGAMPIQTFKNVIAEELKRAKPFILKGLKGNTLYRELIKEGKPSLVSKKPLPATNKLAKIAMHGYEACIGDKNAPVTIIEFSELQCPYCKRASSIVNSVIEQYKGNVKLCFKHRPLAMHSNAKQISLYLIAIKNLYGDAKFFETLNLLFKTQNEWNKTSDETFFKKRFTQIGMNWNKIKKVSKSSKAEEILQKDTVEASKVGVRGVPVFFVNGLKITGARPKNVFTNIIDKLIEHKNLSEKSMEKEDGKTDNM